MRGLFTIFILLQILFLSCSKSGDDSLVEKPISEGERLYKVRFYAKDILQSVIPMAATIRRSATSDAVNLFDLNMSLVIYRNNQLVQEITHQDYLYANGEINKDFGYFDLEMPEGNDYELGLVAYSKDLSFTTRLIPASPLAIEGPSFFLNTYTYASRQIVNSNSSIFINDIRTFEVKSDSIYSPIELKRKFGRVNLKINDALPNNVASVMIGSLYSSTIRVFAKDQFYYNPIFFSYPVPPNAVNDNLVFSFNFIENESESHSFDVLFFDSNNVLLHSKRIDGVKIKANFITNLEGEMFSGQTSSGNAQVSSVIRESFEEEQINQSY